MDSNTTPSTEPTCKSLAPWLTEDGAPVTCILTVGSNGKHYGSHVGNGWTWDEVIAMDRADREENPFYVRCTCTWTYGLDEPISSFVSLANGAAAHSEETGHLLRRHGGRLA